MTGSSSRFPQADRTWVGPRRCERHDLLEQLEVSNDVPEVLGEDGTIDGVRNDIEFGLEIAGPDTPLTALV